MHCSNTSLHLAHVWFCVQLNFRNIFLILQKHCYFKSSTPLLFSSQTTYFRSAYSSLFTRVWLTGEQLFTDVLFAGSSLAALANFYCLTDHSSLINKMHTQKRSPRTGSFREWNGLRESYRALFKFWILISWCTLQSKSHKSCNGKPSLYLLFFFFFPSISHDRHWRGREKKDINQNKKTQTIFSRDN